MNTLVLATSFPSLEGFIIFLLVTFCLFCKGGDIRKF